MKTFLKDKEIQILLKKIVKNKGRKLIISNSNKMKPLINALKMQQTIPTGSLKKLEPSRKHPKKKFSLVKEGNNFIMKF